MTMPAETPREIRAVLDRSALQSYARGHVHIGELLIDVADEEAEMAIPAATLADAHELLIEDEHARALLHLLVTLPGTAVLKLDGATASAMAATLAQAEGDLSRAHAVWAANQHGALYVTTEPETVVSLIPPDNAHPISSKDA
jgi:hypothetical protein